MLKLPRWIRLSIMGGVLLLLLLPIVLAIISLFGGGAKLASAGVKRNVRATATPNTFDSWYEESMVEPAEGYLPEASVTPEPLKKHDRSEAVTHLQEKLMELGYLDLDEPTDYFGNATQYAVELFQRQHDLEQDGVVGTQSQDLLYSADAQPYVMKEGAIGKDVKALQEQLYDLGYMDKKDIDSQYGEKTIASVQAFQKRNKLRDDGKAGEKTLDKIYSDDAKLSAAKVKELEKEKEKEKQNNKDKDKDKGTTSSSTIRIDKLISAAKSKLGCEYILGDRGPKSFDCSGLVYYCLREAGVSINRLNARGYANKSSWKRIDSIGGLKKGDLIFFTSPGGNTVSHVGIYIGSNTMIDASSGNGEVVRRPLSNYFKKNFYCGRRPFG